MSAWQLAQLNVGIIKGPMDSPIMAQFAGGLERINALADAAPGFVWRLQTEAGDATALRPFANENQLLNLSVWEDADSLRRFVYRTAHAEFLRRRHEWFEKMPAEILVLWWVSRGHRPGVAEAIPRLELLRRMGPHPEAFTFRRVFPAPDAPAGEQPGVYENQCPAT